MQARKALLFQDDISWIKRSENENFDVLMGSYDGAEVWKLAGGFLLNKLSHIIDKSFVGLYRDDGLGVLRNCTFSNFLDTTFNLMNNTYKPYRKPNDQLFYINKHSNHPPSVLRQLPKSISKRISEISSICSCKLLKTLALTKNLYITKKIPPQMSRMKRTKRKRKIIWFNPPYSNTVKTNIGKLFLKLVE